MAREIKYLLRKSNYSKGDRHIRNAKYHDSRPTKGSKKGQMDPDDLPKKEGMSRGKNGWSNYGIDTSLVKRWLYSQVGKDFDHVYSEFLKRVQPKYLDTHRDCIYWYVLKKKKVIMIDGEAHENNTRIGPIKLPTNARGNLRFFVHPDTNILHVASTYKRKKNA